jgi:hypothetical protein
MLQQCVYVIKQRTWAEQTLIEAENYYAADYPEDEVDDDDEYDRNAYRYRNQNASDNEEYDVRHDAAEEKHLGEFVRQAWTKGATGPEV